jgi:hypothetical protein
MGRMGVALAVGVAVAVVTAGCAGQVSGSEPGTPQVSGIPQVHPSWASCSAEVGPSAMPDVAAGNDSLALPRLDDGFPAVAAIVCAQKAERRPDGGEDLVAIESRADDVAAILTALRLPDEPATDGPCTADLVIAPWLVLLDGQGRWVRPGVPVDTCGKPRIEVRTAVEGLRLTRISTRPVQEIESAEAAAAGCSQAWADMIWVEAGMDSAKVPADVGPLDDGPAQVRLCAYRVPGSEQRTGKPRGDSCTAAW